MPSKYVVLHTHPFHSFIHTFAFDYRYFYHTSQKNSNNNKNILVFSFVMK